jgi:hypothetical protein
MDQKISITRMLIGNTVWYRDGPGPSMGEEKEKQVQGVL